MQVLLLIATLAWALSIAVAEIYDPLNVFCGATSCYEVLGLDRESTMKEIKKAYRKMSLSAHPDKVSDKEEATIAFHKISKAYEVLSNNESKALFDYYLDHPRDYFKVSGQHYYKSLPKSDARVVVAIAIGLFSWLLYHIQMTKYNKLIKYLRDSILGNLSLKNGGSKQTVELFNRAVELYNLKITELKSRGNFSTGKVKMLDDPLFAEVVDKMISELKIEGGHKKPQVKDIFAIQLITFPYTFYVWASTYYRRYHSNQPLSDEDKYEMARTRVGYGSWEECTPEEQDQFIAMEVWKPGVFEQWLQQREEEMRKKAVRMSKLSKKEKKRLQEQLREENFEDDE